MATSSVLIAYLSIGSGHQVAANSLAEVMRSSSPKMPTIVKDPFSNVVKLLPSAMTRLQAAVNLLAPNFYEAIWRRGTIKCTSIANSYWLQGILLKELERINPSAIVATHVIPCLVANQLKKTKQLGNTKVFGVVTDFGLNPIWPIEGMDGYFVAHDELRQSLIYRGVAPDIIHVSGIPIQPSFQPKTTSRSNCLRVLMMAGGIRNGGYGAIRNQIIQILQTLDGFDPACVEITIVAGNQPRLEQELKILAHKTEYQLNIRGFVDNMGDLLSIHDIVFTKPGGLIIAEALATGIPLILSRPTPGVEAANLEFLARHGAAMRGETLSDIFRSIRMCLKHPDALQQMKSEAANLGHPNSSMKTATYILESLHARAATGKYRPILQPANRITSALQKS
ncbi:MAG: hypothetical protein FJZ87_01325 [Chloroflexi bacterium]|nr:hypothetical protein [Chloroflexota bacterium]